MSAFELEPRYLVAKIRDAQRALTVSELDMLLYLLNKVDETRVGSGRGPLLGVFIEHDWAIYPEVVGLIEYLEEKGHE